MTIPISNFIAEIKSKGLARTNRYMAMITFPSLDTEPQRLCSMFCESLTLPGVNVATAGHRLNGEVREFPYERSFDPVQMTFYVDAQMRIKKAFDDWHNKIVNPSTRNIGFYDDIKQDIPIYVYNVDDSNPYTIKLYEAYPKTIGSIQMSSDSKDVMKLSVTMIYKYWKVDPDPNAPQRALDSLQDPSSVYTGTGFPGGDFYSSLQYYDASGYSDYL